MLVAAAVRAATVDSITDAMIKTGATLKISNQRYQGQAVQSRRQALQVRTRQPSISS
jgi:hypothetical protein